MVKLIDVARAAGVSHGTASNVLNNPAMVRPALRERVQAAMLELGYAGPDPKGRLLRDGKFNAIGVKPPSEWNVSESLRNPVFSEFLQGVGEVCDAHGANLVLMSGHIDGAGSNALVDGMIFARVEHLREVAPAQLRRMPFAVIDFDPGPDVNAVRVDARFGARLAAQHLIDLGHRQFGIMSFLRDRGAARVHPTGAARTAEAAGTFTDQQKYLGYGDAMAEAGLQISDIPMVQADVYDRSAAGLMLDAAVGATAILSMSVMHAVEIVAEAKRRGLSVPRDLSVVGYNDTVEAAQCSPPLTTVDGLTRQKGRDAARLLFEGGPPRHEVLVPHLIVRGTTGVPLQRGG